jgi:SAM-dependent methyltransferase
MDLSHRDEYRYKTADYAAPLSEEDIARGEHRRRIGRKWAVMGPLQRDFMVAQGLQPHHRLLDVGCGPLRAGIHFVEYLDSGHYYGIDINESLLDAGHSRELPERLHVKLPRDQLRATERFSCDFGVEFDYAIANSVFTHVSLNHVRLCLYRVARQLAPDGRFYASYFHAPIGHPVDVSRNKGRRWTERNAFFYYDSDLEWAARWADLDVRFIGEWGHPHGQRMAEFTHTRRRVRPRALAKRAVRRVSPRVQRPIKRVLGSRI